MPKNLVATPAVTSRKRAIWMDVVRGVAILAVIYGHAESVGRQDGLFESAPWMIVSNQVLVLLRMPLLMFLSGMLVPRSLRRGWKNFLPGKFTKLAWPYAVWIALYFVMLWIHDVASLSEIPMNILWPENPNRTVLWYLRNLFFYYLIAQGLRWLRLPLWSGALLGGGIGLWQVISNPAATTSELRFGYLMLFFFLGAIASQYRERITEICRKPPMTVLLICLFAIPALIYVEGILPVRYRIEFFWGPLAFIGLVLAFAPLLKSSSWTKPFEFIGRYSLYYYVMHYHVLVGYSWWISWRIGTPNWIHFPLMLGLSMLVPTITIFLARKIPLITWLFFELPWPRKKKVSA